MVKNNIGDRCKS